MNLKIDNGQLTIDFGNAGIGKDGSGSGHEDGLRFQIYWPEIKWKNYKKSLNHPFCPRNHKEFYVCFATRFRFVKEDNYIGIGGSILGFGAAFDYQTK